MTNVHPLKIFGLGSTKEYADKVAKNLNISLTPHIEKYFPDGECYVKSSDETLGNVRGHDVFIIQSLYSDEFESVADKFMKLCMFCGSLKDASAHEIIPVIVHLAWSRQDRKTESRSPVSTKYVARMLESCHVNKVLFFDVHNLAAEQNAFCVPIDNLEGKNLFAEWFADNLLKDGKADRIKILSPDSGGLGRCSRFRTSLLKQLHKRGAKLDDIEIVIFDKLRIEGKVRGSRIIGNVEDSYVIAFDDMISTAETMMKACNAVTQAGGHIYAICATHGLFCGKANEVLDNLNSKIVITDTIRPWRLNSGNQNKLHIVDTTKMVAEAIHKIHSGTGSISELLR